MQRKPDLCRSPYTHWMHHICLHNAEKKSISIPYYRERALWAQREHFAQTTSNLSHDVLQGILLTLRIHIVGILHEEVSRQNYLIRTSFSSHHVICKNQSHFYFECILHKLVIYFRFLCHLYISEWTFACSSPIIYGTYTICTYIFVH